MDSSTQRMLERARARRQKLDEQLKNSGQEATRKRNPLQENNQPQLVKVTTEVEVVLSSQDSVKNVNVSPTKVEVSGPGQKENTVVESSKEYKNHRTTDDLESDRERNIRSQLKRLGALYSDSQISSPIHRTENNFTVEAETVKSNKPSARVARFAVLADNIKQWEDDLSHPSRGYQFQDDSNINDASKAEKPVASHIGFSRQTETNKKANISKKVSEDEKEEKVNNKLNDTKIYQLQQSSRKEVKERVATKKIVWDEKVLQILDSSRNTSSHKPVAPVKHTSNESVQKNFKTSEYKIEAPSISQGNSVGNTSRKFAVATPSLKHIDEERLEQKLESPSKSGENLIQVKPMGSPSKSGGNPGVPKPMGSPSKSGVNPGVAKPMGSPSKSGGNPGVAKPMGSPSMSGGIPAVIKPIGSPRKIPGDSPKAGSVLHKASIFESYSPTKKTKDPAELPISERMALFERNKGQALIPKAAFSMPVPSKYLENNDKKSWLACSPDKGRILGKNMNVNPVNSELSGKAVLLERTKDESSAETNGSSKVLSCRSLFEGVLRSEAGDNMLSEQSERQKDLDMLRNRWNKNKNLSSELQNKNCNKTKEIIVPVPPPLPQENCISPVKTSFSILPQVTHMIPKTSSSEEQYCGKIIRSQNSVQMPHESSKNAVDYSGLCKVKKIKVSPPKPGKLYPCLSDIEATTTETESEVPETEQDSASDSSIVTDSDTGNTSFGREILEAAGIHNTSSNQHQSNKADSSDSDLSESAISADIDGCINEALAGYDSSSDSEQEGPTPPKRTRDYSRSPPKGKKNVKHSSNSKPSQSFRYTHCGYSDGSSPLKSPVIQREENVPMHVVEGDQEMPLMHSVSFYRRQQNLALKNTPVKQIVRPPEIMIEKRTETSSENEEKLVRKKVTDLLDEVSKQQTVISQASQALNLCSATVEFSGSAEQVEGERLLLLATHKRQAALHEIQRLKVEGTLKPVSDAGGASSSFDKGSLLVTNIALSLKKDYVRKLSTEDTCYHFVCLVRSQEQVLGTQVLAATSQNLQENCNLVWNSTLRLVDLYSDFKVTLEVYSLQSRREMLPHNVKYHIGNKKETGKSWLTPKKQKQESRLIMPSIQSPAGPSAVRSPEFRMAGYVVFSLRELGRTHFTLNKVSYSSPLEGNIQVKMKSEMSVDICERGFLTMFEDISGFGAWHRRWFVLNGSMLAYWKYPDDERKVPIGQIDLNSCTTEQVGLVSRDICARPNTFLLETTRPVQSDDRESLVLVKCRDRTIIRNLLSADTKEERLVWCGQLNKALAMLRAWGKKQENF